MCGTPLNGGLLYTFQVGTVATPQLSYQDTALTIPNPFPLVLDANGRVPPFYLANGSIHVRLTDASGVVQFDYPNMLVIGPSSGGGGGGAVDPTTVLSTGDIKFRAAAEAVPLAGFVKANGLTIGNTGSGATGRANADTQALYIYLWTNCSQPTANRHCPVSGGLGANALADFNANKALAVFDLRGRSPFGLDDMGAAAAGRIAANNVTSGGGDGPTTPNATGGEANHTLTVGELAAHNHTATDSGHTHPFTDDAAFNYAATGGSTAIRNIAATGLPFATATASGTANITVTNTGSGTAHNVMNPFILGTWYLKL